MRPTIEQTSVRLRELGTELTWHRENAGLNGTGLARIMGWHPSKVSKLEHGYRGVASEVDVAVYLATCRVPKWEINRLLDMHTTWDKGTWTRPHDPRLPDELRSLIVQETMATAMSGYDPLVVPGLAQTEDYARALFIESGLVCADRIESRVRARMDRQGLLRRWQPPQCEAFIHEQALRLPVGGMQVMHEQMLHLTLLAALPHWSIRVVPSSAGPHCGALSPFKLMKYDNHRPAAYTEATATSVFLEQPDDVAIFRSILANLAKAALTEQQSAEYLANLASDFDRAEEDRYERAPAGGFEVANQ